MANALRPKTPQAEGGDPVGQRRLFEIADAVDVQRHPVAGLEHGLRGLGVGGVGVVQQRWSPQRGEEDGQPESEDGEQRGRRGDGGGGGLLLGGAAGVAGWWPLELPLRLRGGGGVRAISGGG